MSISNENPSDIPDLPDEVVITREELLDGMINSTDRTLVQRVRDAFSVPGHSPGVCKIARDDLEKIIALAMAGEDAQRRLLESERRVKQLEATLANPDRTRRS